MTALTASVVGPATSPGTLLHSRRVLRDRNTGVNSKLHRRLRPSPSTSPLSPSWSSDPSSSSSTSSAGESSRLTRGSNYHDELEDRPTRWQSEEELVWWDQCVVWSRGAEVYRQWSFDDLTSGRLGSGSDSNSGSSSGTQERVAWAGFVWFPNSGTSTATVTPSSFAPTRRLEKGGPDETFGPFHTAQYASWGGPDAPVSSDSATAATSSSPGTGTGLVRTLVIILGTKGMVYHPMGESTSFHLPFPCSTAFALPRSEGGGMFLQRDLEKRELKRFNGGNSMLSGLALGFDGRKSKGGRRSSGFGAAGMTSVLDEVLDLDDEQDLPRLYTLSDPFEELKAVVEGKVRNERLVGTEERIEPSMSVLFSGQDDGDGTAYPLVVLLDRTTSEIIFYRRTRISLDAPSAQPPPTSSARTMRPEELLRQGTTVPSSIMGTGTGTPSVGIGLGPGPGSRVRPSLHRATSGTGPSTGQGDRQVSGNMMDPMDRTRRVSRMSKAATTGTAEGLPPTSTGDLQAALDPPALPVAATSNITTRSRAHRAHRESLGTGTGTGTGTGSGSGSGPGSRVTSNSHQPLNGMTTMGGASAGDTRRQSGASSFMREDPDAGKGNGGNALHGVGDRDLRETTMMMGIEREEEAVRSEVVLERIWVWKPPQQIDPATTNMFISDNLTPGHANLNISTSSTLYVFRAERLPSNSKWTVYPLSSHPCDSAIPIISTRPKVFDTLILHRDRLTIITSFDKTIDLSLPKVGGMERDELPTKLASSLSMRLDEDDSMDSHSKGGAVGAGSRPIALEDPVDSRFTLLYEDGERLRLCVDFAIRDKLVRNCMEAMAWVMAPDQTFAFKQKVMAALQALPPVSRDKGAVWEAFMECLFGFLRVTSTSEQLSDRQEMAQSAAASSDPTTRRLASKLHILAPNTRSAASSSPDIGNILFALHIVAQEYRLSTLRQKSFERIASLVLSLCRSAKRTDWWDYWMRIIPKDSEKPTGTPSPSPLLDTFESPPDILQYLSRRLITPLKAFPSLCSLGVVPLTEYGSDPCTMTTLVIALFDRFGYSPRDTRKQGESAVARAASCVRYMIDEGLDAEWVSTLPCGIAVPILEMMRTCQLVPAKDWPVGMYELIGRPDLAAQASTDWSDGHGPAEASDADVPSIADIARSVISSQSRAPPSAQPHVRFGSDRRVQEVERILQTTRPRTIMIEEPKNANDHEIAQYHQGTVNTIANRTLAIPIAQGIFEYGTRSAIITDTWDIPLIELSVRILPAKTTLQAHIVGDNAEWPCFHNGVARALSISPDCTGIDSSWILFNRPQTLNPEHGGFLLGLGLTGHLRSLVTYHAFPYLEPRHDFTSVGLLLGLACAYAGSQDLLITKILSLHTHALLPLGSMELNASTIIQCSALVGLGLVYVGSKNLRMAEIALAEVGQRDLVGVEGYSDYQEAYSFSASMTFGLIMLGRGGQASSETDRRMLNKLHRCISGESATVHGSAGGINTTLTAPGAILALGMMYLKTGRQDIAQSLELPQSAFELEHFRPDTLLLRTLARAMIMWKDVQPSLQWIEAQIPSFINYNGHKRTSHLELNTELAYFNVIAGACLAIGLKYAGTATELAHTNLMIFFSVLSKAAAGSSMTYEGKIRRAAARQALNVVTIALSVVMSGTGELNLLRRLRISHGQEGAGVTYGTHMAMHMACGILFLGRGHYTLGNSNLAIAAMAIAFFPRFLSGLADNTAYPQAFRHLWALAVEPRCLVAKDVNTRETVYLPVKVKIAEGDHTRFHKLISPTLIAPLDTIRSIEIDSPRYWPIGYGLSDDRNRQALVRTRTLRVKRKAGFLDYNSDPKGNRSIFVKAGSMTGFDLYYDLVSPSSPPTISSQEVLDLMVAHSGSPALISLARHFMSDYPLDVFLRTLMLECVGLDKPLALGVYWGMLLSSATHSPTTETINQLALLKAFYAVFEKNYAVSAGQERRFALLRSNFIAVLWKRMVQSDAMDGNAQREYYEKQSWSGDSMALARWMLTSNVPQARLLDELRRRVRDSPGAGEEVLSRVRDAAKAYHSAIASRYDEVEASEGDRTDSWVIVGVEQAVNVWSAT